MARKVSIRPGALLAGKYRVERVLGEGGMGRVVAAMHTGLQNRRAIKLLHADLAKSPDAVRRFRQEARAASCIGSEHAAKVFDIGELEDGVPYIVMEHLTGSDLGAVLKRDGAQPASAAALYLIQACDALADAHALGIVHRDLKPANLFLLRAGDGSPSIKVLDFGISKMTGLAPNAEDRAATSTDATLGSPLYMSPEQVHDTQGVDARSDIWSAGVILYELVTGRAPFGGATVSQTIWKVEKVSPPPPSRHNPAVPEALDAVVMRCLEKDPKDRYANVAELARALLPFAPEQARRLVERAEQTLARVRGVKSAQPAAETNPLEGTLSPTTTITLVPLKGDWASSRSRLRAGLLLVTTVSVVLGAAAVLYRGQTVRVSQAVEAPLRELAGSLAEMSLPALAEAPPASGSAGIPRACDVDKADHAKGTASPEGKPSLGNGGQSLSGRSIKYVEPDGMSAMTRSRIK